MLMTLKRMMVCQVINAPIFNFIVIIFNDLILLFCFICLTFKKMTIWTQIDWQRHQDLVQHYVRIRMQKIHSKCLLVADRER